MSLAFPPVVRRLWGDGVTSGQRFSTRCSFYSQRASILDFKGSAIVVSTGESLNPTGGLDVGES